MVEVHHPTLTGTQWSNAIELNSDGSEHDPDPQFPKLAHINNPLERGSGQDKDFRNHTAIVIEAGDTIKPGTIPRQAAHKMLDQLELKLMEANNALKKGRFTKALALSTEIVERSLPFRFSDPRAEQLLADATRIAKESSQQSEKKNEKPNKMVPTRFNG